MANPVWPAALPQRLVADNYQETAPWGTLRTDMDAGPAKSRPRFTAAVEPVTGTIICDTAQLRAFKNFFRDDIKFGALAFDWHETTPDYESVDDIIAPWTVDDIVDMDSLTLRRTFRFTKPPTWRSVGGGMYYEVSMELEKLP